MQIPILPNGRLVVAEDGRHDIIQATDAQLEQNTICILHDANIEKCEYIDNNWYTDADEPEYKNSSILSRIINSLTK